MQHHIAIKLRFLLILDELGYVPFQKQGAELLFHIIADCYEQKSVIITSNLEFGQWNHVFGDNRLTLALVDRLVHHAHIIACTRENYRKRNTLSFASSEIYIKKRELQASAILCIFCLQKTYSSMRSIDSTLFN